MADNQETSFTTESKTWSNGISFMQKYIILAFRYSPELRAASAPDGRLKHFVTGIGTTPLHLVAGNLKQGHRWNAQANGKCIRPESALTRAFILLMTAAVSVNVSFPTIFTQSQ